jgi:hypothetical protein
MEQFDLFSAFGGILGLFLGILMVILINCLWFSNLFYLGMSILSFVEIIEISFNLIYTFLTYTHNKQKNIKIMDDSEQYNTSSVPSKE